VPKETTERKSGNMLKKPKKLIHAKEPFKLKFVIKRGFTHILCNFATICRNVAQSFGTPSADNRK
jgi:hypothetical protein